LYIPAYESYQLSLIGPPAQLLFDGQGVAVPYTAALLPGWHHVVVTAEMPTATPLQVGLATGAGAPVVALPATAFWPVAATGGLLGAVRDPNGNARPRVDLFIGFTAVAEPVVIGPGQQAAFPVQARWAGGIQAPTAGPYTLELRTDGGAVLAVDGKPVLAACSTGDAGAVPVTLTLTAGWHPIQIDYVARPGHLILEFYWTPPGGERTLVPPAALSQAPAGATPAIPVLPPLPEGCGLP
jgi:hypothetical protein